MGKIMTVGEMIAKHHQDATFWRWRETLKEFESTALGASFYRFENACAAYWALDAVEFISDKTLKETQQRLDKARDELRSLMFAEKTRNKI